MPIINNLNPRVPSPRTWPAIQALLHVLLLAAYGVAILSGRIERSRPAYLWTGLCTGISFAAALHKTGWTWRPAGLSSTADADRRRVHVALQDVVIEPPSNVAENDTSDDDSADSGIEYNRFE